MVEFAISGRGSCAGSVLLRFQKQAQRSLSPERKDSSLILTDEPTDRIDQANHQYMNPDSVTELNILKYTG